MKVALTALFGMNRTALKGVPGSVIAALVVKMTEQASGITDKTTGKRH
jgi:hypothetical protein